MLKIAVVDYDMGNLHSVCKGLQHAGAQPLITHLPSELASADAIVLPGVGAFDPAVKKISGDLSGITDFIRSIG